MKLPKNYFENLSASKYRAYLKLLPNMQQEQAQSLVMLILTFAALSFFGVFAINPTLSTIADLQKQLSDNTLVDQQLQTKISNLSALQQQYDQLGPNLTNILSAVPQNADAPLLTAQVAALTQKHHLKLTSYRVDEVELTTLPKVKKSQSFVFTLEARGEYNDMVSFATELNQLSRVITVETMEVGQDSNTGTLTVTVRGREYFKQ